MRSNWFVLRVILTAVCALGLGTAHAQSTNSGDISGVVSDVSGAALPGVTVSVVNVNTGVSKDFITNSDGLYDTSSIVAGTYKITFSKTGFSQLVRSSVTLIVGNTTINAQLKVGSVTDSVVVNIDVPLLKTEERESRPPRSAPRPYRSFHK